MSGLNRRNLGFSAIFVCLAFAACTASAAAIHDAVRTNNLTVLAGILKADPAKAGEKMKSGILPIHLAARYNHAQALGLLLKAGADINARTDSGSTALHWAAHSGSKDVIKSLLAAGALADARTTDGQAPLHWAVIGKSADAVAMLIASGKVDVDAATKDGNTPLHLAAQKDAADIISMLISAGADVYAKAKDGHAPAFWAKSKAARDVFESSADEPAPAAPVIADGEPAVPTPHSPVQPDVVNIKSPPAVTDEEHDEDVPAYSGNTLSRSKRIISFDDATYSGETDSSAKRMHGFGILTFTDGERYEGNWVNGRKHGRGIHLIPIGGGFDKYQGDWREDKMWGHGVYTFSNGGRIEGSWKKNKLVEGSGTYIFANGDRYEGQWRNDKMSGYGVYTMADGTKLEGNWEDNDLLNEGTAPANDRSSLESLQSTGDRNDQASSGQTMEIRPGLTGIVNR